MAAEPAPAPAKGDVLGRLVLRALWVARVPVASILIAALLFLMVPQAQDLLIELKREGWHTLLYWTGFFLFGILFWVLPVHMSARLALQLGYERIGIDTAERYRLLVVWLPRALGVLCLLTICLGIWQAYLNVPEPATKSGITEGARKILLINALVASGLVVAYLAAFRIWSSGRALEHPQQIAPTLFPFTRRIVRWLRAKAEKLRGRREPLMARASFLTESEREIQRNTLVTVFFFLVVLWLLGVLVWLMYLAVPHLEGWRVPLVDCRFTKDAFFENVLPRAILLLTVLGWFVPFLTIASILSHKVRHPFIVYFAVLLALISLMDKRRHDLRVVTSDAGQRRAMAQIPIEAAVLAWKEANNCPKKGCRPIIVAAEGGASRAAFFTASALALMQDRATRRLGKDFTKSLFAVAGVSGGALGVAAFVAADEVQRPGRRPDVKPGEAKKACGTFGGWFGWHGDAAAQMPDWFESRPRTKMVQQFLSNDFLTPPFAAYIFYDMLGLRFLGGVSRGRALENSWESQFERVSGSQAFQRPFSQFAPDIGAAEVDWRPLMLFHGSSVETGQRIMVSSLAPRSTRGTRIFRDSLDLYELMCKGCDIRLSTAVTTSSRFPLISAPGTIRGAGGAVVARVVDGGYFDYFAITTAVEIAQAIIKVDPDLKPLVLLISNDPGSFPEMCGEVSEQTAASQGKWFRSLRDPLETVLNSRVARARHAALSADDLKNVQHKRIIVCPQKRGADQYKKLSKSWWLSLPVQEYLHDQLKAAHNVKVMDSILEALPANK